MKRFFNYLLMATISLTAICTTSCNQINPLTPDEQLTEKIIGKWKVTSTTMDTYVDGKLISSKTEDYPISFVDVFNADGTWDNFWAEKTCDDPSDPANADKLIFYTKGGTFSIKDSVLTIKYGADNTYGEALLGEGSEYLIISITDSTMTRFSEIEEDGGQLIKMISNSKKMK